MQFYTNNLSCRLLEQKDKADFCALYTDEKVMRKIAPAFSQEKAQAQFSKCLSLNQHVPFERQTFVIENKQGQFCGIQGLVWPQAGADRAEIGIMLQQKATGKAIPVEGMGALVDMGFCHFGLAQIYAYFNPGNIAVERFVSRLGFIVESEVTQHHGFDAKYCYIDLPMWQTSAERVQAKTCQLHNSKVINL